MIRKYFSGSEFAKNVATLVTGTGIAQLITFLSAPVLSRLFSPEEFSVFALFTSTTAIIGVAAAGRYELAIPLPKEEDDARALVRLSMIITAIVCVFTFSGVLVYGSFFGAEKGSRFSLVFYMLPLAVAAGAFYNIFNFWSTRKKTFTLNSIARIVLSATMAGFTILFGYLRFGSKGLIIGFVLGQVISAMLLALPLFRSPSQFFSGAASSRMSSQAKTYRAFLTVNTPHALVDSLQDNGVVYLLTYYFAEAVTGCYSFAFRILKAPVGLVGSAFYQVFYQRLSHAKNESQDMRPLVRSMFIRLFLLGLPGFLILGIFTPQIFSFVFSEKWREAGVIAQILVPWLFLNFIISPVSCITLVCGKQKQAFLITLIDITIRFSALIVGGMMNDYKMSFLIISISCSGIMLFSVWWYYKLAKDAFEGIK